ncbi:MAG: hypothetical protein ACRDL7_14620, partial [Gaiellaceae bacterium]
RWADRARPAIDWLQFCLFLVLSYTNLNAREEARADLKKIAQGSRTLAEYNAHYVMLQNQLGVERSNYEETEGYIEGLNSHTANKVWGKSPKLLEQAMALANKYETRFLEQKRRMAEQKDRQLHFLQQNKGGDLRVNANSKKSFKYQRNSSHKSGGGKQQRWKNKGHEAAEMNTLRNKALTNVEASSAPKRQFFKGMRRDNGQTCGFCGCAGHLEEVCFANKLGKNFHPERVSDERREELQKRGIRLPPRPARPDRPMGRKN